MSCKMPLGCVSIASELHVGWSGMWKIVCFLLFCELGLSACGPHDSGPKPDYSDAGDNVSPLPPPPPPPPIRACTDIESQLVVNAFAQKISDSDRCVFVKKNTTASLNSCEFERETSLIKATGSVTIYDDFTSDSFGLNSSGIFSSTGEVLQLSITETSEAYDQACNRAKVVVGTLVVACAADANCRESN